MKTTNLKKILAIASIAASITAQNAFALNPGAVAKPVMKTAKKALGLSDAFASTTTKLFSSMEKVFGKEAANMFENLKNVVDVDAVKYFDNAIKQADQSGDLEASIKLATAKNLIEKSLKEELEPSELETLYRSIVLHGTDKNNALVLSSHCKKEIAETGAGDVIKVTDKRVLSQEFMKSNKDAMDYVSKNFSLVSKNNAPDIEAKDAKALAVHIDATKNGNTLALAINKLMSNFDGVASVANGTALYGVSIKSIGQDSYQARLTEVINRMTVKAQDIDSGSAEGRTSLERIYHDTLDELIMLQADTNGIKGIQADEMPRYKKLKQAKKDLINGNCVLPKAA